MNRRTIAIAGVLLGLLSLGIGAHWRSRLPIPDPKGFSAATDRADSAAAPLSGLAPETEYPAPVGDLRIVARAGGKSADGAAVTVVRESTQERKCLTLPADGIQTVLKMPSGQYHVRVCHSRCLFATAGIQVEAGKTVEVKLDLIEGSSLYGKIVDSSGQPLEGARVGIVQPREGGALAHDLATFTTSTGEYTLDGIPPGTFNVRVRREGYRSWERTDLTLSGPGCRMELHATLSRGRSLAGRVLTERGAPVSGAVIMASNEDVAMGRSDLEGSFALHGLGDTAAWASASAEGYGIVTVLGLTPDSTEIEFRLPRAASLLGDLEATPKPDRFIVRLLRVDASLAAERPDCERLFTQASGRFFLSGITPGRYRVQVLAEGFETQDAPVIELGSGQSLSDLKIRLEQKASKGPP
jgi:hypothetical protein